MPSEDKQIGVIMIQGSCKIKQIISGLVLLMLSLYPLTAYSQPFLKPLGGAGKALLSTPNIVESFVRNSMRESGYRLYSPTVIDAVTKGGSYSLLETRMLTSGSRPLRISHNSYYKEWKSPLLLTDVVKNKRLYPSYFHSDLITSSESSPLRLNNVIDERPQVKCLNEVDVKCIDTNKESYRVFSPELLVQENEKPSPPFHPHSVLITPNKQNDNAGVSAPINYINTELSTPISVPIDDNKWWLEYIENEIEKVMFKLNINIPFNEEKNVNQSFIFYYSLHDEYGLAA